MTVTYNGSSVNVSQFNYTFYFPVLRLPMHLHVKQGIPNKFVVYKNVATFQITPLSDPL